MNFLLKGSATISVHNLGGGCLCPTEMFVPGLQLMIEAFTSPKKAFPKFDHIKLGNALSYLVYGIFPNSTINIGITWPFYVGGGVGFHYVRYKVVYLMSKYLQFVSDC